MKMYKDQITEICDRYRRDYGKLLDELEYAPEGNMINSNAHGRSRYLKIIYENGKQRRTVLHDDNAIKHYARKAYIQKAKSALESNIKVLEKAMNAIVDYSPDAMIGKLPRAYIELPVEYFCINLASGREEGHRSDEARRLKEHADWAREDYEKSSMYPEHLIHRTSLGFRVRSKSELLIIEQLADYGVIPRYEQLLYLGSYTFVPDFTFLDSKGDEFYWEHAGRMDDRNYQMNHKRKMELYERAGIVPWQNLIVTYDIRGELNLPMIRSIIEHDVLPRII